MKRKIENDFDEYKNNNDFDKLKEKINEDIKMREKKDEKKEFDFQNLVSVLLFIFLIAIIILSILKK